MAHGVVVAVGLVEHLAVGEAALIVEQCHQSYVALASLAFLQHFVVVALVALLDVGVLAQQVGKVGLFACLCLFHLRLVVLCLCYERKTVELVQQLVGLLLCQRLLLLVEGCEYGLQYHLLIGFDACVGDVLGDRESKCPAEAVGLGAELGGFACVDGDFVFRGAGCRYSDYAQHRCG